jgi:hypothetical protein
MRRSGGTVRAAQPGIAETLEVVLSDHARRLRSEIVKLLLWQRQQV